MKITQFSCTSFSFTYGEDEYSKRAGFTPHSPRRPSPSPSRTLEFSPSAPPRRSRHSELGDTPTPRKKHRKGKKATPKSSASKRRDYKGGSVEMQGPNFRCEVAAETAKGRNGSDSECAMPEVDYNDDSEDSS